MSQSLTRPTLRTCQKYLTFYRRTTLLCSTHPTARWPNSLPHIFISNIHTIDDFMARTHRPKLLVDKSKLYHSNYGKWLVHPEEVQNFFLECEDKLNGAGMIVAESKEIKLFYVSLAIAIVNKYPPDQEARSRKAFAELPPFAKMEAKFKYITPRRLYDNLDIQADAIYMLARIQVERDPKYRRYAAYLLSIAAEMDHIDAALLLYRLGRVDKSLSIGKVHKRVLWKAKDELLHWKAVVAIIEDSVLDRSQRSISDIRQALRLLKQVMTEHEPDTMLPLNENVSATIALRLQDRLNADALENFDPPARIYWNLVRQEIARIQVLPVAERDMILQWFEQCLWQDAEVYQNPMAKWELLCLRQDQPDPAIEVYSEQWVSFMHEAALADIPDACLLVGKYHLDKDKWYPTQKMSEGQSRPRLEEDAGITFIIRRAEIHSAMARTDVENLRVAAHYVFVAGLYLENGFKLKAIAILQQGIEQLVTSPCHVDVKQKALRFVEGYIQNFQDPMKEGSELEEDARPQALLAELGL